MSKDYNPHTLTYTLSHNQGVDVVGDIHGCLPELIDLLTKAGYKIDRRGDDFDISHPENRKLFFVGDIVDRGPENLDSIRFVRSMIASGIGSCTIGNHDFKLLRFLSGRPVTVARGLETSVAELEAKADAFDRRLALGTLKSLPTQILIRKERNDRFGAPRNILIVHASAPERHQGLPMDHSFERAIYGYPEDDDENGNPVRSDWAADYQGKTMVIHGHEPTPRVIAKNNVFNLDTGCVFGGYLTLMRVFEGKYIHVRARKPYHPRDGFA